VRRTQEYGATVLKKADVLERSGNVSGFLRADEEELGKPYRRRSCGCYPHPEGGGVGISWRF